MLIQRYFEAVHDLIADLSASEAGNIDSAAQLCADSLAAGGVVHIHDSGHMLSHELIHRAGGLAGFTPLTFGLNVTNPNLFREKSEPRPDVTDETISLALKAANIRPGDVLFMGSVSGKARRIVELALQAKAAGVKVVALTSLAYSRRLDSEHPSGVRLYEAADLVIDNHAPYGDSVLEIDGLDAKACPASGIAAACIMWAVTAGTVEKLLEQGIVPTVFKSANAPGGSEDVRQRQERYKRLGY